MSDAVPTPALLRNFATNYWWSYNTAARQLVLELQSLLSPAGESDLTHVHPTRAICLADDQELSRIINLPAISQRVTTLCRNFQNEMSKATWWQQQRPPQEIEVAFFSAEFGIDSSLPIYSGGLGVLAGDILKAASDLGVPLFGVSLFYHEGYFHQRIDREGRQSEEYPPLDPEALGLTPVLDASGSPLRFNLNLDTEPVAVRAWEAHVGRTKLYLLDTNLDPNTPRARAITARLYGGDTENRIRQEVVLGIGGSRLISSLGLAPELYHMNEGHSAFLALAQCAELIERHGLSPAQALAIVRESHLFTTHTPVAAGNDLFGRDLVMRYLKPYADEIGVEIAQVLRLGRVNQDDEHEPFSMSVLGLRTSGISNAVSQLHGEVSRQIWQGIWPGSPPEEIPISHVTNGVHIQSWLAEEMAALFDSSLGRQWRSNEQDEKSWSAISDLDNTELWNVRNRLRTKLVEYARRAHSRAYARRHHATAPDFDSKDVLNPQILTFGFARRFAAYKRASLLFRDFERFARLLQDSKHPIQFLFAGKAHPADLPAKDILAQVFGVSHSAEMAKRFVFLEDYDMEIARMLVQGVDVWLNTPRRPLEASGTSGMKAALNGALNLSILDGWWCEGYDGENGWAIESGDVADGDDAQDARDHQRLFALLEQEVIPLFYQRNAAGVPERWLNKVKHSLRTIPPRFSAHRMVAEYATRFYVPHALMQRSGK